MNFVKRAAHSLAARKGRTAMLLGIFLVIGVLLLGSSLLRGATARQEAEAQRRIGVDVTVRGDGLTTDTAAALGGSPLVERYNPMLRGTTAPPGLDPVTPDAPEPAGAEEDGRDGAGGDGGDGGDGLALSGIRDSGLLPDFARGRTELVAGRGITAHDADREVLLLEERLAERNGLRVGDTVELASPDGAVRTSFEIIGLYRTPLPTPAAWVPPRDIPANQLYAPLPAVSALGFGSALDEVVLTVGSPDTARELAALAEELLGPDGFRADVNDKAYREQVEPLQRVGALAGVFGWLTSLGGAAVLGLIVTLEIRSRRAELGMLLSLGERKWRLLGQHTAEAVAVAVPALALAAVLGLALARPAGEALLPPSPDGPAPLLMTAGDVGSVAAIGLGIALAATVLPGAAIVRLHPRSLLTHSE
ncbi:FtsX-like permease family protein [Streptomyces xiamenensis]|uniref:FtsX-like permease family protein n=1 Tax=Streptomyces xiamenensis TaxID=408015 RepID=UPI003D75B9FB